MSLTSQHNFDIKIAETMIFTNLNELECFKKETEEKIELFKD